MEIIMSNNNSSALPKREEIEQKYKWKLEDIYSSNDLWEEDFLKVKKLASEIQGFSGKLGEGASNLLNCFKACDEMLALNDKVYVYARMRRDENNANSTYQALTDRAQALATDAYAAVSFITPEILSIEEKKLLGFLEENKELKLYEQYIKEMLRQKAHILTQKEEELLALGSEVTHAAGDIFTMLNNADIKFPMVKDENGNEVELTKGRYSKFLESSNRNVREEAFRALYATYSKFKNTLACSLASNVKKNKYYTTVRKYNSSLESALDSDNVKTEVYDNLIETIGNNLPVLHRYLKLRKKILKLDELRMFDLYVPMVAESKKTVTYEQAIEITEKGLEPMGEEYLKYLRNAFNTGWIDVFENEGKTSGAYSWGTHLTHPYVLLNFQGTINDVFTIAHEMGHALHSFYTNKTQPYIYSEYKIFVAEVASTVNENLLMKYLLGKTESKQEKAYLLNHYLEEFRGTVFRQVMFAEFEKIIHAKTEAGEALTADSLCEIYLNLNKKYYGDEVVYDDEIAMEWSRIPHFYSSFYVYKYATGFSAAASLSKQILEEGKPAVDRYIDFLKSGGSDYPIELLKKAGVDLSTPKPVQDALDIFAEIVSELEELLV